MESKTDNSEVKVEGVHDITALRDRRKQDCLRNGVEVFHGVVVQPEG